MLLDYNIYENWILKYKRIWNRITPHNRKLQISTINSWRYTTAHLKKSIIIGKKKQRRKKTKEKKTHKKPYHSNYFFSFCIQILMKVTVHSEKCPSLYTFIDYFHCSVKRVTQIVHNHIWQSQTYFQVATLAVLFSVANSYRQIRKGKKIMDGGNVKAACSQLVKF